VAAAGQARAQTILDQTLAGDPSIVSREFRYLAQPATNPPGADYTFAFGTSADGNYVAGESEAPCPANPNAVCLRAAVWTPSFGSSPALDRPFILPTGGGAADSATDYRSQARAIDLDGDTIVGREEFDSGPQLRALAWSRLPGTSWEASAQATLLQPQSGFTGAGARGISDDGNFAVGWMASGEPPTARAALWERTGQTDWEVAQNLGSLNADPLSVANGVALDAAGDPVVVGWSGSTTLDGPPLEQAVLYGSDEPGNVFGALWTPVPFVWTQSTGMVQLQSNSTYLRGDATAISADAKTIVGWNQRAERGTENYVEAVRWTNTGGTSWSAPQGLGTFGLPQDINVPFDSSNRHPLGSVALAVSEQGNAVVGYQSFGFLGGGSTASPRFRLAFIWTEALGTGRYLGDVLKQAGVSLGDWVLFTATGVRESKDYFVVVGDGSNTGTIPVPAPGYIARLGRTPESPSGITTPAEQIESFGAVSSAALGIGSTVGTTLTGLNDMAENHRCIRPQDGPVGNWCVFGFGTAGIFSGDDALDGNEFSGDVGIAHYFGPVTSIGGSIGGGRVDTDLLLGGGYQANDLHLGGYLAHIPDTGLRLFGAGVWGDLSDVDLTRGYLNGIGLTHSSGSTEGDGWGVLGRVGYGFKAGANSLSTPFAEITYTDAKLDGYSETGGPFPTSFDGIETDTTTGRLGVLQETDLSSTLRLFGSAAWVHVLDSEAPTVRGAVLDIFELSARGDTGLSDWAEFTAGARTQVSQRGVVSVTGRIGTEFDEFFAMQGRVGYSQIF
jgi:uncharacterized membrane protein